MEIPLTKREDETQTAFAIRAIKAEAWAEGFNDGHAFPSLPNPYADPKVEAPVATPEDHTNACGDYNHDAGWWVYRCICDQEEA